MFNHLRVVLLASQRARELRQDRQVGVQLHTILTAYAQRQQRPLMLETAELTLDTRPAAVEVFVPLGPARDQRVQPVGFEPHRSGLALSGRAAPLGGAAVVVGPGERPLA